MLEFENKKVKDVIAKAQRLRALRFKLRLIEEYASMVDNDEDLSAIDEESIDKIYHNIKGKAMYSYAKHFI